MNITQVINLIVFAIVLLLSLIFIYFFIFVSISWGRLVFYILVKKKDYQLKQKVITIFLIPFSSYVGIEDKKIQGLEKRLKKDLRHMLITLIIAGVIQLIYFLFLRYFNF